MKIREITGKKTTQNNNTLEAAGCIPLRPGVLGLSDLLSLRMGKLRGRKCVWS